MFSNLKQPYIIAELSGNHNGDIERAKAMIKSAKDNGAHCVKLQTYTADTMTIQSNKPEFQITQGLWSGYSLWDLYDWAHTPFEWHEELFNFARSISITMISTPFDETAVELLERLNTPFYKVASFELTDLALIETIGRTKKPILLSTGMANLDEIAEALEIVKTCDSEYALLHCISGYPTPVNEVNLLTIPMLRAQFNCEVGLSDHTQSNVAAITSVGFGVKIIEKHFTLNRDDGGPDKDFSIEPSELNALCKDVSDAYKAIGKPMFRPTKSEEVNIQFRRSIYAVKPIKKGEPFRPDNIKRIRPGHGLAPKYYKILMTAYALHDLEAGEAITQQDISIALI